MSEDIAEKIDKTDVQILELLQQDGRMSVSDISKKDALLFFGLDRHHFAHIIRPAD